MIEYEVVDKEYLPEDDAWLFWIELTDTDTGESYSLSSVVASEDKIEALQFLQDNLEDFMQQPRDMGKGHSCF